MRYYAPNIDKVYTGELAEIERWYPNTYLIPLYDDPTLTENTSFSGNFQFVWDSVSLTAFKKCPRYYNWTVRQGYRLNPQPSTLAFGIYFHLVAETWHKLLATGLSKDGALLRCVRLAGLLGEYLTPERSERTKETLVRCCVWYLDQFRDDIAVTTTRGDGTPAVEYSFMLPLVEIDGVQTYLAGHLDRVVEFLGEIYLADYKTTKGQLNERFFAGFKPNTQVQGYLAAGHILAGSVHAIPKTPKGLIIDGIQLGVNFNRFARLPIEYTRLEINTYLAGLELWLEQAARCADKEHWPANEQSCDQYGGCMFRSICSQTPAKHEVLLEGNFVRSVWDPRKAR